MKGNLIAWVVIGVIVVGGGAYYFFDANKPAAEVPVTASETQAASAETQQASAPAKAGAFTGSIADLSARGGNWKCTVDSETHAGAQSVSNGVVYVSGKSVRGDFTTNVQGFGTVQGHMIADGSFVYVWSSVLPQGIKAKQTASGQPSSSTSGQGMDANQSYSYDCAPATADASLFVVPTNVTFRAI